MLADQFDAFFLDLDGVVYIEGQALPGTLPSLQRLRTMGKHIRFLTNNPCKTRERLVERLRIITTCFRCKVVGGQLQGDQQETLGAQFADPQQLPEPFMLVHRQWINDALTQTEQTFIR